MATNLSLNLLPLAANWQVCITKPYCFTSPALASRERAGALPQCWRAAVLHDDVTHLPEILVLVKLSDLGRGGRYIERPILMDDISIFWVISTIYRYRYIAHP